MRLCKTCRHFKKRVRVSVSLKGKTLEPEFTLLRLSTIDAQAVF